ncbi:MAG: sugar phosphate isomerase/epimerase [Planctomycetes bacterium]|nr:sugar phosphate isomerase/epimerase [Planctomycetota bacterium]
MKPPDSDHPAAGWTRRKLLAAAAGGVVGAGSLGSLAAAGPAEEEKTGERPAAPAPAPAPAPPAGPRPKITAVSWCFHGLERGAKPEEAIEALGEMGFEGVELILCDRKDVEEYWTDAKVSELRKRLEHWKLAVPQFVVFWPVLKGLVSPDAEERKQALDGFEAGCAIAVKLGAPVMNFVAPWARELKGPGGYLPRHYDLASAKPGEKFRIEIAPELDWDGVWATFVESVEACLERAKAHGLKLSIEHHTHCLVPEAASFLRLWDAVQDPALGYNLDTGWTLLGREHPAVAIHKVKRHLLNVHARDIDGLMRSFVHVGEGVMDFKAVAETLKAVGYRGAISLEQDKYPGDMKATCKRYLAILKEHLG